MCATVREIEKGGGREGGREGGERERKGERERERPRNYITMVISYSFDTK